MGLDVCGYRGLVPIDRPESDDDEDSGWVEVFSNATEFLDRLPPLKVGPYRFSERRHFFARATAAYLDMREALAEAAGWPPHPQCPEEWRSFPCSWFCVQASDVTRSGKLWRLINFAANHGWIGSESCKIIAEELAEVLPLLDRRQDQAEQILAAFQFAAVEGGGVRFS
jgi:hypothetical protein